MELVYPWILIVGIPLLLFLIIFKIKKEKKYKTGTKIANTQYAKKIPYYQKLLAKYKLITLALKIVCIICILASLILLARPIKVEKSETKLHSRDIYICMDASTSVNELNLELVESFKKTIDSLDGERIGITIFNTSSVVLVPLTDDYEYVKETLDTIAAAINYQEKASSSIASLDEYDMYLANYMFEGTLVGNQTRGSSLIGEGLASCIYDFPDLDEDRSRIIIFSTDNDLNDMYNTQMISVTQAAKLAQEKNIKLFSIVPKIARAQDKDELKKATEAAGGTYYEGTSDSTVDGIIENIDKQSKSLINTKTETKEIGIPEIPFILLIVSITILFILNKKVKI